MHFNAPRSNSVRKTLDEAARAVVTKIQYKIEKDLQHYKSLTIRGRYLCSNRFAEKVFGSFKKIEQEKTSATTESVIQLTIAKVNKLETYIDNMSESQNKALWEKIDGKTALQNYRCARIGTQLKLQDIAARRKEEIENEKAQKLLKKEKKKEEMKTPLRAALPKRRKVVKNFD